MPMYKQHIRHFLYNHVLTKHCHSTEGHAFNHSILCNYLGQRQDPKSTVLCKMVEVQLRSAEG